MRRLSLLFSLLLIVLIPIYLSFIAPRMFDLPIDFHFSADVISKDNFYDRELGVYSGPTSSLTTFSYYIDKVNGNITSIKNVFDVRKFTGEQIFSVKRTYAINTNTWGHANGGDRPRTGYLFAPRMKGYFAQVADKSSFEYWHVNYDAPAIMEYREEQDLFGLSVYRYEANFSVDQTKELSSSLLEVGKTLGVVLNVRLQTWIEPYSGRMIQYQDNTEAYYYDLETGKKLYPWNKFTNTFAPYSVTKLARDTSIIKNTMLVASWGVSGVMLVLSFLMLSFGLVGNVGRVSQKHAIACAVVVGCIVIIGTTSIIWLWNLILHRQQIESEFQEEVAVTSNRIQERLAVYASFLRDGVGVFNIKEAVTRQEWKSFFLAGSANTFYPGMQGLGYAKIVSNEQKQAYEKKVVDDGFESFRITPEGEKDIYVPVTFLEPLDARNKEVLGFDLSSEQVRRLALNYARDSGEIAMSGQIILKHDIGSDAQAGFLMLAPVYTQGLPVVTIAQRRSAITAFVYSSFRVRDFIKGALINSDLNLYFEIYDTADSENLSSESLIFSNLQKNNLDPRHRETTTLQFGGHSWVIRFFAPVGYGIDVIRGGVGYVLGFIGGMSAIILSLSTYILLSRTVKAYQLADSLVVDLKAEKDQADKFRIEAETRANETDRINRFMVDRELRMIELKDEIKKLKQEKHI